MAIAENRRWKEWADNLRQQLMSSLTSEITKSVVDIKSETNSTKTEAALGSVRFWASCQNGTSPNDQLAKAGFEIEFEPDDTKQVKEVTFRLNDKWMPILKSVIERNNGRNESSQDNG